MSMNRKGFFKTLFGGFIAASTVPSLVKAEDNPQPPKDLSLSGEALRIDTSGDIRLGTNTPKQVLHVSGIVFHINDRRLEMSGTENGDFKIKWLDVKNDESHPCIVVSKPQTNLFSSIPHDIR